ncbi:IS1/IS1595 family N-terminal zinc-binding domain-containing protein [Legionella sp. CNM-1927-20]|uniref:IS1/IS1595 family N-terminal zinc-binding domain-containing protein n=1 Tax=Legionella sp. CNM-1927-20 TaxID=3422221 RepID=UPI00403A8B01
MIKLYFLFRVVKKNDKNQVLCPTCHSTQVAKFGFTAVGKQRFRCDNNNCPKKTLF